MGGLSASPVQPKPPAPPPLDACLPLSPCAPQVTTLSGSLTPSYAASLLLSLSALQHRPKYWLARTLAAIQPQLRACGPGDVAQLLLAFARLHYSPHPEWWFEFTLEVRLWVCGDRVAAGAKCGGVLRVSGHVLPLAADLALPGSLVSCFVQVSGPFCQVLGPTCQVLGPSWQRSTQQQH